MHDSSETDKIIPQRLSILTISEDDMSSSRSIFGGSGSELPPQVDQDGCSAKSQVLGDLDLLELTFGFFDIHPERNIFNPVKLKKNDRAYLLWVSTTCKVFFEAAMNVLWRSMDEWMPLMKLIPTLIRQGSLYTTSRPIRRKDMQRFHLYAKRIRHLQFFGSINFLSSHIIPSISQSRQFKIFPTLQTLSIPRFGSIIPENVPFLFLLPSSTLFKVSITGVDAKLEVLAASLLRAIRVESEVITEVKLEGKLTTASLDVIHEFRTLQDLHISLQDNGNAFPVQFLKDMADMKNLKRLTLRLDSRVAFNPGEDDSSEWRPRNRSQRRSWRPKFRSTFNTLDTLELLGSAVAVKSILQSAYAPHLKSISLVLSTLGPDVSSMEPNGILEGCVRSLAADMANCLESINITSLSPDVRIPHQALSWFHVFKRLKSMDIMIDTLPKDVISVLVSLGEWVALETLTLKVGKARLTRLVAAPAFSLSHMDLLALLCPNLTTLAISASLSFLRKDIMSMREEIKRKCLCHKLRMLELLPFADQDPYYETATTNRPSRSQVGFSCQDILTISRFVNHLFPSLIDIDLTQIYAMDGSWCDDVMATVKQLQEVWRDKHRCT